MNNKVLEVRKEIKDFFKDLEFDEPTHRYTVGGSPLTSVSHFIGKYKNKFDADKMAPLVAKKRGVTTEEILKEWEEIKNKACDLGTKVHLFGENYVNDGFQGEASCGYEEAIVNFWKILPEHIVPLIMELQMYNKNWGIAGTTDIILYNTKTNKLILADYKTNKDLFNNYQQQKLTTPFNELLDDSYNAYQIQLSTYQLLLEQTGYEVESRIIVHIKPDGTYQCYKTQDLRELIKQELSNE